MTFAISLIITALLDIFILYLALLVLKKNPRLKINQIFFWLTLSIFLWMIFIFFENEINNVNLASICLQFDFAMGSCIVGFFLLFAVYFPDRDQVLAGWKKILLCLVCGFFALLPFSGWLIGDFSIKNQGIRYEPGSFYDIYSVFMLGMIVWGSYILIRKYFRFTGQKRLQVLYVLISFGLTGLITAVINLFFANNLPIEISRIGIYCFVIFIGSTAYAIIRYHLMDIRVIIQKSLVFTFSLVFISAIYALIIFSVSYLAKGLSLNWLIFSAGLSVLIIIITLPILERKFTKLTDKIFFKAPINYKEALKTLNYIFATEIKFSQLLANTKKILLDTFKLKSVNFYFCNEKKYTSLAAEAKRGILLLKNSKQANYLIKYFTAAKTNHNILIREDLARETLAVKDIMQVKKLLAGLNQLACELIMPIFGQKELLGLICLGSKLDDNPYFTQDIEWLDIIAKQFGLALEMSLVYENLEELVNQRTKELKLANQKLKEISAAKSEFVSVASHQLKTPLSIIRNIFSLLIAGDLGKISKDQADYGQRGLSHSEKLIKLINILLNISRIETGRLNMEISSNNINDLIKERTSAFDSIIKNKKINIKFLLNSKIPPLKFDKNLIAEVIDNLIDNAVKYTPQGQITLITEKIPNAIRFKISDTGLGIAIGQESRLFRRFIRGVEKSKVYIAGTGLGLYFCRRVIEAHDGKIWAESKGVNQGSTFIFDLPIIN